MTGDIALIQNTSLLFTQYLIKLYVYYIFGYDGSIVNFLFVKLVYLNVCIPMSLEVTPCLNLHETKLKCGISIEILNSPV
ncbi:hypothetical protein L6452_20699 [Arctium lappa]|uniref:Uncharacterized protein n=1 Tax=Arctium lappa TaxID=4217 RepID=A0ACB9BBN2_ARCLA|nr:hypothetical protein L6452_20699 [Arctium lappa]